MRSLKIPEAYAPGFAAIMNLDDSEMDQVLAALSEVSPSLAGGGHRKMAAHLAAKVRGLSEPDASSIMLTVVSLYVAQADSYVTIDDFAEALCQAAERSDNERLGAVRNKRERTKERLIRLLSFEAIQVGSKALEIGGEYEHNLCSLRIFTDIRPVFGEETAQLPAAGIVTHTLKIVYHRGDQTSEFFVKLDSRQLATLREQIDRADSKAISLKLLLDKAGVPAVDRQEHGD